MKNLKLTNRNQIKCTTNSLNSLKYNKIIK